MSDRAYFALDHAISIFIEQKPRLIFCCCDEIARETLPYRGIANTLMHAPNRERRKGEAIGDDSTILRGKSEWSSSCLTARIYRVCPGCYFLPSTSLKSVLRTLVHLLVHLPCRAVSAFAATVPLGLADAIYEGVFFVPLPSVSVVIPALNEGRNIPHVFARIPSGTHQVILVDGESTDNTVEAARNARPDILVVNQTRRGKGNALACGFKAATGDVIVMLDADGSADPGEIPRFIDALVAGADFAKGTRFALGGGSSDITSLRRVGNDALTGVFNLCYGRQYSDLCYGYNVFWRYCLPVLGLDATTPPPPGGGKLWGDGFEVETLIHVRIAKAGLKVAEVPSYEYPRLHGASNLNATRDGLRVVRTMLAEWHGWRPAPAPVRAPSPVAAVPAAAVSVVASAAAAPKESVL
jgi:hypothetical protein